MADTAAITVGATSTTTAVSKLIKSNFNYCPRALFANANAPFTAFPLSPIFPFPHSIYSPFPICRPCRRSHLAQCHFAWLHAFYMRRK